MDRIRPSLRPDRPVIGYQRWRDLLFIHWSLPVSEVRPLVPRSLEIDVFDGLAWIGITPFAAYGVRPVGVPERLGLNFLEVNLRTYVHVQGRDPGVFFFSLDASSRLAVLGARILWGVPYHHARIRSEHELGVLSYESVRTDQSAPRFSVRCRTGTAMGRAATGTLEHFLIERYLLHVERAGRLFTGQLYHAPYPLHHAEVIHVEDELAAAAGLPRPDGAPIAHYSRGVDAELFWLRGTA